MAGRCRVQTVIQECFRSGFLPCFARPMIDARRLAPFAPLLLGLIVALPGNGARRPLEEHEVFVARTAEEMKRGGALLEPTFNGSPRLVKPPLSYWLVLAADRLDLDRSERIGELEARLPSALAAVLLGLVTCWIAVAAFDERRAGLAAGALCATSAGVAGFAHNARPEMVYALGCAVELLGFVLVLRARERGRRGGGPAMLAWLGFLWALLAKGPLLPSFVALGVAAAACIARPRVPLRAALRPGIGALVVLPAAAAVFGAMALANPGAPRLWWDQMIHHGGGTSPAWHLPLQGYYLYAGPMLLLPWLVLLPGGLRLGWNRGRPRALCLALAALVPAACLSFSPARHAYYLLPALPGLLALMGGAAVQRFDQDAADSARERTLHGMVALHLAFVACAAIALALWSRGPLAIVLSPAAVTALGSGAFVLLRSRSAGAPAGAAGALATGVALVLALAAHAGVDRSSRRLDRARFAREVAGLVPASATLASEGSLLELCVYYADRRVLRAPDELEGPHPGGPRVYAVARRDQLDQPWLAGARVVLSGTGGASGLVAAELLPGRASGDGGAAPSQASATLKQAPPPGAEPRAMLPP
jgi:4-amino-4-deoxy-L-arabinose transferase-like glycosyltransferase